MWNIDAAELVSALIPTMTIWREASGEGMAGMLAVAMVIRNRALRRHLTPDAVCLQPWQFSSMTAKGDAALLHWPAASDTSFQIAYQQWIASASIHAEDDPTKGADFYFADGITTPSWARAFTATVTIGRQHFYRS